MSRIIPPQGPQEAQGAGVRSPSERFTSVAISAALAAAVRTGILAQLGRGPATTAALIEQLGLDPRATGLVLDVLVTHGWAQRDGERIEPGPRLRELEDSPGGLELVLGMWAHVEHFVRTGDPFALMDQSPPERERVYVTLVGDLGRLLEEPARALAERLPVQPRRVLDVGCGSGVWGLAIAERNRDVHVTGLDLSAVLESFRARAAALSLDDRIAAISGDMHEAAIPAAAFDLVIVANVLRLETPDRAAQLIGRLAPAVAPGGSLLVVDALSDGTPESDRNLSVYALHLGLRTKSGQVHTADAIAAWLADAGLPHTRAIPLPEGAGVVAALLATRV